MRCRQSLQLLVVFQEAELALGVQIGDCPFPISRSMAAPWSLQRGRLRCKDVAPQVRDLVGHDVAR
jgi:hypothetical protein